MALTERFLKAKHWQIFMLTFGFVLIAEIILISLMLLNTPDIETNPLLMFNYFKIVPLIMLSGAASAFISVQ